MVEDSDLSEPEQATRRAELLKSKAQSSADDLTEDDIADLYHLVAEGCDSRKVTLSALDALNTIAKTHPALLSGILPHLIQNHLTLPPRYDDDDFAFEDVSTNPEIGRPVHASWILHNIAKHDPTLLSAHTDLLTEVYRSDTTQSHYFLLALGRLVVAEIDGLPVASIQADLHKLLDRDDWYAAEAEAILTRLE